MSNKPLIALATLLAFTASSQAADRQDATAAQVRSSAAYADIGSASSNAGMVFDQGPASGSLAGCWQNQTEQQNFADTVVFSKATQVQAITIYTCAPPVSNATVHLKILSKGPTGFPGYVLRKEDGPVTSWTASPVSGVGYAVTYTFAKPFSAGAGKTYWFGLSGNDFDLSQDTVSTPGNGMIAKYSGKNFMGNVLIGDQMFQLSGQ